jgi:hypothetical protein
MRLPDCLFRLRSSCRLQSFATDDLEGVLAYLLPFRPWLALDLRVFGHPQFAKQSCLTKTALLPFNATLASYSPERRLNAGLQCRL